MKRAFVMLAALSLLAMAVIAQDSTKSAQPSAKETPAKAAEQKVDKAKATGDKMEKKAAEPKVVTTKTGLKYIDHVVGKGAEAVTGATVSVHYTGWLDEGGGKHGQKFDSSKDRNQPFDVPLGMGKVIKGWDEGIVGMKGGARAN